MALQRHSPIILSGIFPILLSVLLLFGCAQKTVPPALEEARSAVQEARSDPSVSRDAPIQLQKAAAALDKSEQLFRQNAETVKIEHQAYLAKQHAAIARQIGKRGEAQDAIRNSSAERSKVLIEARAAEADYARLQAKKHRAASKQARAETELAEERAAKLEAELAEMKAVQEDRGIVVTLGDVVFDVDKAGLKPGGMLTVQKLAEFLVKNPSRRVTVEGFTDSTGSEEYNQALSERRAGAVRDALVRKGIDPSRIDIRGYGEAYPVASNDTVAGRQLNRRVEIIISDGKGTVPERSK